MYIWNCRFIVGAVRDEGLASRSRDSQRSAQQSYKAIACQKLQNREIDVPRLDYGYNIGNLWHSFND